MAVHLLVKAQTATTLFFPQLLVLLAEEVEEISLVVPVAMVKMVALVGAQEQQGV
jgi:general stress protein CsbA